ncbi:hypothetical protein BpHYR1_002783 [Brachionus plicatilis]|uniref:Uncharacterized protein n=1 Tax=Brachionus plicatilis TaxID=10195 RepID=A0A3M7RFT9_BRAPC|nr:hypothetical protein BpHYR1_002783 [Brachionus plicatilis]
MQHHSQDPGYSASPQPEIRFWRMQHKLTTRIFLAVYFGGPKIRPPSWPANADTVTVSEKLAAKNRPCNGPLENNKQFKKLSFFLAFSFLPIFTPFFAQILSVMEGNKSDLILKRI